MLLVCVVWVWQDDIMKTYSNYIRTRTLCLINKYYTSIYFINRSANSTNGVFKHRLSRNLLAISYSNNTIKTFQIFRIATQVVGSRWVCNDFRVFWNCNDFTNCAASCLPTVQRGAGGWRGRYDVVRCKRAASVDWVGQGFLA